jgi:hypothetical protein
VTISPQLQRLHVQQTILREHFGSEFVLDSFISMRLLQWSDSENLDAILRTRNAGPV